MHDGGWRKSDIPKSNSEYVVDENSKKSNEFIGRA